MALEYDQLGNVIGDFGDAPAGYTGTGGSGRGGRGGPTAAEQDIYRHQPNRITASDEFKLNFLPNILDNFDVNTYHFKLFITSLENAAAGTVLNTNNQVIIAENGVTDLTIDKVEIHGITGPSIEAGTGTQTILKFEIIEPSGAGLLDKMFYQATALGIGNWLVMPCYLQLEFRGRVPATSASSANGAPQALAGLKWLWPIKLTNAKANVTKAGTKYEFDAIMYDELAQSNSYFAIQQNIVLSGLRNFGDAMQNLEDKLNDDAYEKLIDNYSIPDTYKIIVDPELVNIPLADPSDNKSTSFGADYINFTEKTASFNAGTGIDKIVDAILGNTKKYQKLMQGSDTAAGEPKPSQAQTDQMKKLWRIVTETRPTKFDALRQDNAVAITIYVVEYDLGMTDANASQTGQTSETIAADKRRMLEYVKKKIMNKRYNYIFTGLNDQVINFDLNMNFSFAASLARFGGIYYDSAISMPGVAVQKDNDDKEKKATEILRNILRFINDPANKDKSDAKIKEARDAIQSSKIDPVLISRYTTLLDHAKRVDRQTYVPDVIKNNGHDASGKFSQSKKTAGYLATPIGTDGASGTNLRFISDVNYNSPEAKEAYEMAKALRRGKLRPVPFKEGMQERALIGMDPGSDAGRARVANIFSTALHSTLDASLQSVKLTIKGDPYWLFPRNIDTNLKELPRLSINSIKDTDNTNSVNTLCTDNFAVIRFRTPQIHSTTTGTISPLSDSEMFSGVYKVITIINKFEMGKFTQELMCLLDPVINLIDFTKEMEAASKKLDPVDPPEKSSLPDTVKKTQKILGQADSIKGQEQTARNSITGEIQDRSLRTFGKVTESSLSNIPDIKRTI